MEGTESSPKETMIVLLDKLIEETLKATRFVHDVQVSVIKVDN